VCVCVSVCFEVGVFVRWRAKRKQPDSPNIVDNLEVVSNFNFNRWPHSLYVPNNDTTTPPLPTLPRPQSGSETKCGRWSSSWAVTRLHSNIGLTGYRSNDLLHIRRPLYPRVGKEWLTYVTTFYIFTELRHLSRRPCCSRGHHVSRVVHRR
jgi:hypothetical protein